MKAVFPDKIRQYGFKRLLLAVSGGLDSICLAHYFIENRESLGIEWLGIAHVHHGLREKTADRDAAFVESFAKSHGVSFFLKKLDGEALKNTDGSLEENAREARYKALAEIINEAGDPDDKKGAIVTAHHAGDQAETMYMRLQRGTTLAGLRGIQEVREVQCEMWNVECGITHHTFHTTHSIYRPFLSVTRAELLAYARENKLEWCEDESNSDVKFARNKVRHEFLPKLEQEYPGASEQLCRIAALADRAYGKVMEACAGMFGNTMLNGKEIPACAGMTKEGAGMTKEGAGMTNPEPHASNPEPRVSITLDKKKLRKVLLAHENADLSEMFRLWLSEKGLRFPIGFFHDAGEPAHVKIPHHAVYRRRAIAKIGNTVQICEFSTPEEALNFVSCGKKDKGL